MENCRGFLSSSWKCGLCNSFICPDCHAVKSERQDDNHVCDEEVKATIAMIKTETRPCPKCSHAIFKIDGCDQMWCTQCHTAFSWRTGAISSGRIHNPHFIQFEREGGHLGRTPGDVPCGGPPNARTLDHWCVLRGYQGVSGFIQGTLSGWKFFNYARIQSLYDGTAGPHDRGTSRQIIGCRTYMPFPTEFPIAYLGSARRMYSMGRLLGLVLAMVGEVRAHEDDICRPVFGVIGRRNMIFKDRHLGDSLINPEDITESVRGIRNLRQLRDHISVSVQDRILPLEQEDIDICILIGIPWIGMGDSCSLADTLDGIDPTFTDGSFDVENVCSASDDDRYSVAQSVINACRIVPHIIEVMLPRVAPNQDTTCRQLRMAYLTGNINLERWRTRLKAVSKKVLKNRDTSMILDMITLTLTDILQRFTTEGDMDVDIELETLRRYANEQLTHVSKRFGNVMPHVQQKWRGFSSNVLDV